MSVVHSMCWMGTHWVGHVFTWVLNDLDLLEVFIVPHRFLQDSWGFLRIPEDSQDSILADVPATCWSPVGVYS